MVMNRGFVSYIADVVYGATAYPSGWCKPSVVYGHFTQDQKGAYQQIFFDELLRIGFQRTFWQLVFPGQVAGLVKKIPEKNDGTNEYHIRFYDDGTIDCELEVHRFASMHWVGARKHGVTLLEDILEGEMNIPERTKQEVRRQFGVKKYSDSCVRKIQ